jgi:hypothetical protein
MAKRRKVGHCLGTDPEAPISSLASEGDLERELALLAQMEAEAAEGDESDPFFVRSSGPSGDPPPTYDCDEEVAAEWWGSAGLLD